MFHNLYKKDDGYISCGSSYDYQKLENNSIEEAASELGNFIIEKAATALTL